MNLATLTDKEFEELVRTTVNAHLPKMLAVAAQLDGMVFHTSVLCVLSHVVHMAGELGREDREWACQALAKTVDLLWAREPEETASDSPGDDVELVQCPDCEHGYTRAGKAFSRIVHLLMLAGVDAANKRDPHPWLRNLGIESLSPEMGDLTSSLAGRPADRMFGHDAYDKHVAYQKILRAAGMPRDWGVCKTCRGFAAVRRK